MKREGVENRRGQRTCHGTQMVVRRQLSGVSLHLLPYWGSVSCCFSIVVYDSPVSASSLRVLGFQMFDTVSSFLPGSGIWANVF